MIELAGEDFKIDIVNYINLKNSKYNKKIEEKYIDLKKIQFQIIQIYLENIVQNLQAIAVMIKNIL